MCGVINYVHTKNNSSSNPVNSTKNQNVKTQLFYSSSLANSQRVIKYKKNFILTSSVASENMVVCIARTEL